MNSNLNNLRPIYNFKLNYLDDELTSRGKIFQSIMDGSLVLDVGCDTGLFGEALATQKHCVVDGIEPYEPAAEIAKHRLNKVFIRNVDNAQSFAGLNKYDVVLFLDVLEHLIDTESILRGVWQILKPGGVTYITVPNIAHISIVRRLLKGQFEYSDYGTMDRTHLRWFTRSSIRVMLKSTGFEAIDIQVTPQLPFLNQQSKINSFLRKKLTNFFPDQLGGSIVAKAMKLSGNSN